MNLLLKLKEKKYRFIYTKKNYRMKEAMKKFKECKEKKSDKQIRKEIKLCKKYWGCYPFHYFRYKLYRKENNLNEEQLKNYIPEFFFYKLFLNYHDDEKFWFFTEEKNICELIFKSLSISQPKTIFKLVNREKYDFNMNKITYDYLEDLIKKSDCKKIFIKPVDGAGGDGIFVFRKFKDACFRTIDGIKLDKVFISSLLEKDYIAQEGIEQDIFFSNMYPNSVNTLRVATANINGEVRVVCATLRVGRNGRELDNGTQGGLVLGINVDTGEIYDYAITETCEIYYHHPDTKFVFKEQRIPNWDNIKKFTEDSAEKLPQFTYLGWDIAITSHGPIVIETNLAFGLDHFQVPHGGLRKEFNINNPCEYWSIEKKNK